MPGLNAIFNDARSEFIITDAITFLKNYPFKGDELVYCDPPYMHETRGRADLYKFEMTNDQHKELLQVIKQLPCMVMISGYHTKLYADELADWSHTQFEAMTRAAKTATEHLWYNFKTPTILHDYSYLGDNFRARALIKRKAQRWVNRLQSMPLAEQQAILNAIDDADISITAIDNRHK